MIRLADKKEGMSIAVRNWRIVAGGFLQNYSELNGSVLLWRRCYQELADPDTVVIFAGWNDSPRDMAEFIFQLDRESRPPSVRIAGFSWGGTYAVRLCRELERREIPVESLVLCDPIYRHSYFLGNWRAFMPFMRIKVPGNVEEVWSFYQTSSRPRGHKLTTETRTLVHDPIKIKADHVWMDDSPQYHGLTQKVFSEG